MTEQHNIDYQLDNDFCIFMPMQKQSVDQLRAQLTMLLNTKPDVYESDTDYLERRRKILQTGEELKSRGAGLHGLPVQ